VLGRISTAGVVRPSAERALVTSMVDLLRIRTAQPSLTEVGNLSGGNQQKVLLGRWILADCDVLLLFDVTRGVDVATKHEIYDLVVDLARKGKGILLYSSDTEEVAHLCHRVLVLREGRVAAELDAEAQVDKIARYYHEMEQGTLPAGGVHDRVLEALGRVMNVTGAQLRAAGRSVRGAAPGPAGSAAFARVGSPDPDYAAPEEQPETVEPSDAIDALFTRTP
jgi:ABC-type multidrug transport system ATPase subunit